MKRIRELIERYHTLRGEVMELRDIAETTAKKIVDDKAITTLCEMDLSKPEEWSKRIGTKETPS